ncbi:uncharacterized protein [Phyllobates terribilis]|uniref:uncharacterized protein n=1 Tax=Phyllobates terribilis TaxID=111132 RepID=UPI003CCA8E14
MGATNFNLDPHSNSPIQHTKGEHGVLVEEIEGLIKVFKDGRVERPKIVPCVAPSLACDPRVVAQDVVIDKATGVWARVYVPKCCYGHNNGSAPILVYFHGGGFCVGSAAWACYHEFLSRLSGEARCVILSVDYRLAPENRLPAAYEDGIRAIMWLLKQKQSQYIWSKCLDIGNLFLGGDSAGGNIAYNVSSRLISSKLVRPKGIILLQPFFGGEARTKSERYPSSSSVLNLSISDSYWRLALPSGLTRDHPWCNPVGRGSPIKLGGLTRAFPSTMVCIAELDILKDRDLEFSEVLAGVGNRVEYVVYNGVGHAFHVLDRSTISKVRTQEMISHIKAFMYR